MLALGCMAISGLAQAADPAPAPINNPPQAQTAQANSALIAWQRVGSPATQDA